MKKIAIAGAGFAGLSAAWHLLQYPSVSVTLFDPKGIGEGASGVSTGLIHPFPGKLSLKSWQADEAMKASLDLIGRIEETYARPLVDRGGILRLAVTGQQQVDYKKCVDATCEWWPEERVLEVFPQAAKVPALWIPHGATVYSKLYLRGLWDQCAKRGATHRFESLTDAAPFDAVILATGSEVLMSFSLPLKITRGQTLLCRWPKPLPCTLLSQGHLSPTEHPDICQLGSTYEDPSVPRDPKRALELIDKIALFYPPAREYEVVEVKTGFRIARDRGYRPIVAKMDSKTWVFAGLGSRGLLYHAWLGRALAEAVALDYDELRPQELYKSLSP